MSTNAIPECRYCSGWHTGTCPRIKSIEYYEDGTVRRVELHDPNAVLRDPQGWPILVPAAAPPGEPTA